MGSRGESHVLRRRDRMARALDARTYSPSSSAESAQSSLPTETLAGPAAPSGMSQRAVRYRQRFENASEADPVATPTSSTAAASTEHVPSSHTVSPPLDQATTRSASHRRAAVPISGPSRHRNTLSASASGSCRVLTIQHDLAAARASRADVPSSSASSPILGPRRLAGLRARVPPGRATEPAPDVFISDPGEQDMSDAKITHEYNLAAVLERQLKYQVRIL
jgi:hypothetical protein